MKKVIGIISIVLFVFVVFQSHAMEARNAKDISWLAGFLLALCMLIGGIVSIISNRNKGMTIAATVFYVIGGIIGLVNAGHFKDLPTWSMLTLIFAVLFIFHIVGFKDYYNRIEGE